MESPVKQVYIRNEKIINRLQKTLPEKIVSVQVRNKITLFLGKVKKVLTQIENAIPSSAVVHEAIGSEGNVADIFDKNTKLLLRLVPAEKKTPAMERLPLYFANSIKKLVRYLDGDDSWLQAPSNAAGKKESTIEVMKLSIENNSSEDEPPSSEKQTESSKEKNIIGSTDEDPGYPAIYHALSRQTKLNHILDPLFDLLFPQNTHFLSVKHCKKTTGKSLSTVLAANLGQNEPGNKLLYKILTDEVLRKIFNDDKIISVFDKSLNVALLKVVIFTALYRLQKSPEKFPVLGGVSFFIDFEEEMIKSSNIIESLLALIATPAGSKSFFHIKSSMEREGFLSFLAKKKEMYNQIYNNLPDDPDEAKKVTRYWPPKFSSRLTINSSIPENAIDNYFSYEQSNEINQFIRHMHN